MNYPQTENNIEFEKLLKKLTLSSEIEKDYCGCCGREITQSLLPPNARPNLHYFWCKNCYLHLDMTKTYSWEQTYFAQHNRNCPYMEIN